MMHGCSVSSTCRVTDPFGVANDAEMPFLARALDPREAERQLDALPRLSRGRSRLCAIRVTRYKPGRRSVVEYDLETSEPASPSRVMTLVGKVRSRRPAGGSYAFLESLWHGEFGAASPDRIGVPEPVGVVADFRMTLQRKVPGTMAGECLLGPGRVALAGRIADAAAKIHRAGLPAGRRHTMDDELRILRHRLAAVAAEHPRQATRLARLLARSVEVASTVAPPAPAGIHRDFYHDQVIVDGPRLYLLDFDCYCEGDPALDIGNFIGHLTELSLRTRGDPEALADRERALEERYVAQAGERVRQAIHVYAALTVARHIFLSTQFPERRGLTGALMELCEQRLARLRG